MNETTAQVSKWLHVRPGAVWEALQSPAKLKQFFFGAEVLSDWKVGSPITMKGQFQGKPYEDKGTILTVEPERTLRFSHFSPLTGAPDAPENYHVVTFALQPARDGTEVTLTQANLTGGVRVGDVEHRADFEKNWASLLDGLAKVVEAPPSR
jgi:uncharacterized protein YndB with AHSA1/START domain